MGTAKDLKIPLQPNGFRSIQFNSGPSSHPCHIRFLVLKGCRHLLDFPLRSAQGTGNITPSHSRFGYLCNDAICLAAFEKIGFMLRAVQGDTGIRIVVINVALEHAWLVRHRVDVVGR